MYGGMGSCVQGFDGEIRWKEKNLEYLDVDGRIILRWIFQKWDWGTDWIYLP
jgi:hypothetical protein